MAYDAELAGRVRDRMIAVAGVSEKRMFGGLAFLTWGNMTVGVYGDGLLARIEPGTVDRVLAAEPAVRPFDMGGRQMRGWVLVTGASLSDDELDRWVGRCRSYAETLPAKQPRG
jgi:TfoX N-terminal domain